MKRSLIFSSLVLVGFSPLFLRLITCGLTEPVGLLSDLMTSLIFIALFLLSPYWPRVLLTLGWLLFQVGAHELLAAMQRLPAWQDMYYLTDMYFVHNSIAGFTPATPWSVLLLLACACIHCLLPFHRYRLWQLRGLLALFFTLIALHWLADSRLTDQDMTARYSPVHWLTLDGITKIFAGNQRLAPLPPPPGLNELDLSGTSLVTGGKAKNVLIIVLEGIPGLYIPEIASTMGTTDPDATMPKLAAATKDAMLIPDFVVHSHQTIRGLYSMLSGDFSKQSWATPKATEMQFDPQRARECLPARLSAHGWSTHFLQAANLSFMGKDRFMPQIGFDQVHGQEWFTEPNPFPFEWGVIDEVFFRGAEKYIAKLRTDQRPWMLTLLTVGTHQPYAVPDEVAETYPSRKLATVALLDTALAKFLTSLRYQGVLKDTLVIITSDESHGSDLADWISSWGLAIVLPPEGQQLPRIKSGGYGLVDMTASVLDYLQIPPPPSIIGRSFFRDYAPPREMISYTGSTRRWHTASNRRYECSDDGRCLGGFAPSLLGEPVEPLLPVIDRDTQQLLGFTATLDRKLSHTENIKVMQFANGEMRRLPEKLNNEWADNLIGAQAIDFPEKSTIHINIRYKAVESPESGIQLKLLLKQWEQPRSDITVPEFPILFAGEEGAVEFGFDTPEAGQNFSFHLLGEGADSVIQMEEFSIVVKQSQG